MNIWLITLVIVLYVATGIMGYYAMKFYKQDRVTWKAGK